MRKPRDYTLSTVYGLLSAGIIMGMTLTFVPGCKGKKVEPVPESLEHYVTRIAPAPPGMIYVARNGHTGLYYETVEIPKPMVAVYVEVLGIVTENGLITVSYVSGRDTFALEGLSVYGFNQLLKGNIDSVYNH